MFLHEIENEEWAKIRNSILVLYYKTVIWSTDWHLVIKQFMLQTLVFSAAESCLRLWQIQKTNSSSSASFGAALSFNSLSVSAFESLISSKYCNLESLSGAGSLLRYIRKRSSSSSGTSHDNGFEGTTLSQANKLLSEETYHPKEKTRDKH